MKEKLKMLLSLYSTFFFVGLTTFGGGLAMLPILEREVSRKKGWVSSEELLDYYAIAQSTPGIIAVNVATFCGRKMAGVFGGIVATLGVVIPSIIIITLIANFLEVINKTLWVKKALMGINIAVAANLTYAAFGFAKKSIKNVWCLLLYFAGFVSIYFFKVNTIWVILTAAVIGIVLGLVSAKKSKSQSEDLIGGAK